MTISVDWDNKLVLSTASITDIVAFKNAVRDLEDNETGMLYPPVITYKKVDLGGGAFFHAVDAINDYQLKFPNSGTYSIIGNLGMSIIPVAGVFVVQTKAAAFATVSDGGGLGPSQTVTSPSSSQIAEAVWEHPFVSKILTVVKFLGLK